MNWKTSAFGVGTILTVVGTALVAFFDGDPSTAVNFTVLAAGLTAGFGLIFGKDNNK